MLRRWEDEGRRALPTRPISESELRQAARAVAEAFLLVDAVYLFGSRARGTAHLRSDVDVAVLLAAGQEPDDPIHVTAGIARFLEERLDIPVDVVLVSRRLP